MGPHIATGTQRDPNGTPYRNRDTMGPHNALQGPSWNKDTMGPQHIMGSQWDPIVLYGDRYAIGTEMDPIAQWGHGVTMGPQWDGTLLCTIRSFVQWGHNGTPKCNGDTRTRWDPSM